MSVEDKIRSLLGRYEDAPLECDGFVRVASYLLTQAEIDHQIMGGCVFYGCYRVRPHFWIEVGENIVDYRLRMWTDQTAPHGIFPKEECPANYSLGTPMALSATRAIYEILTMETDARLFRDQEPSS